MQIYGNFSTCKLFSAVFSKKTPFPHFYFIPALYFTLTKRQISAQTLDFFLIFDDFKCKNLKKICFLKISDLRRGGKKKSHRAKKKIIGALEIDAVRWFRRMQSALSDRRRDHANHRDDKIREYSFRSRAPVWRAA